MLELNSPRSHSSLHADLPRHVAPTPAVLLPWNLPLKCTMVGAIVSALAAFAVAALYGERQEIQGRILLEPLSPHVAGAQLLPAEDARSLSLGLKSPETLDSAIRRLDLPIVAGDLDRRMETKISVASPTVTASLRWPSAGGDRILDAIMNAFVTDAREARVRSMKARIDSLQAALASCDLDSQKARDELAAFCRSRGVSDLSQEMRLAAADLDALATTFSTLRRNQTSAKAQLAMLDQTIERMSQDHAVSSKAVPTATDPALEKSSVEAGAPLSNPKQRYAPERLQFLIQENRHHHLFETQLAAKRKQYEHWLMVAEQNGASPAELKRIRNDLATIDAQAKDHENISKLKEALADPVQSLLAKRFDVELELQGYEKNLEALPQDEKSKRDRLATLLEVQAAAAPLLNQLQSRESERARLQSYLDSVKLLSEIATTPAKVLQPATVTSTGASRRWLLVASAFACFLIGWLGAVNLYRKRFSAQFAEEAAQQLGLPLMGRIPDRRSTGTPLPPELRAFTHLLRQRVPQRGATVLFSPVAGGAELAHLFRDAGLCFSGRDEKVLILDAVLPTAETNGERVGLSDYLACNEIELDDVVRTSEIDGVDVLTAGAVVVPPDALATHRMRQLMEQVRTRYTLVLVKGHPIASSADVQIMATYADAVVLLLDASSGLRRDFVDALSAHVQAGVPLLGCVRVANEFPEQTKRRISS